jgi:hypothetical protein
VIHLKNNAGLFHTTGDGSTEGHNRDKKDLKYKGFYPVIS